MLTKCICTNCAGHLEFEEENAGEKIKCPHCGFDTTLFLPGEEPSGDSQPRSRLIPKRILITAVALGLVLGGLGYSIYRWLLPPIKDWLNTENPILPVVVLAGGCLALSLALVWTVFPVLLLFQIKRITDVLADLESNSRPLLSAEPLVKEESARSLPDADENKITVGRV